MLVTTGQAKLLERSGRTHALQETLQGKYRILHEIGQGGMAVVYKGLDTALEREVAIKVLHPHLANREDSRVRLQREAKAVARLHHPNILEIYDFSGLDSPKAYIVTEYIRGETLKDFTDRHTPSLPEVGAMVVHEIAGALAHAHDEGIIHRDIKPENIMIRDDGALKLMDFGIAQIVEMQNMTVTGALVGSPAHMSPEHVEGRPLDFRADVFSLGTLLYFLCAGRLPFESPSPHALLRQILESRYDDPRMANPAISRRLHRIIAKCLQKEPDDRYDTVLDLRDDLASYLRDLEIEDPPAELVEYFDDPSLAEAHLTRRVVDRLMVRAKDAASGGNKAMALEYYNQVLALQGDREDALAQVQRLSSHAARSAQLRRLAIAAVALLAMSGGAWWFFSQGQRQSAPASPAVARAGIAGGTAATPAPVDKPTVAAVPEAVEGTAEPLPALERRAAEAVGPAHNRAALTEFAPRSPLLSDASPRRTLETKASRTRKKAPALVRSPRKPANLPAAPAPKQPANGVVQFKLRATTGYLVFEGREYKNGFTPTLQKKPGSYRVTVVPYADTVCCDKRTVSFKIGPKAPNRPIAISPSYRKAKLVVRGTPNAVIQVSGRSGKTGQPIDIRMHQPTSTVQITVSKPGHVARRVRARLKAGQTSSITVTLDKTAP